ncbi:phage integrase N-terminal SAM-like domain-containing protein [bacterium]|nr:phage integrase N-terminal SAM-like domain-containing protein [bacterium]
MKKMKDELRLRNYSPKTIKVYLSCVTNYLRAKGNNFEIIDINFIKQYLLSIVEKGKSSQTIN